jgi:hypothetical protein
VQIKSVPFAGLINLAVENNKIGRGMFFDKQCEIFCEWLAYESGQAKKTAQLEDSGPTRKSLGTLNDHIFVG